MSLTSSVTAQQASGGFAADRPGAIRIDTVSHRYGHGRESVTALGPVSIDVTPGEFLVLVGASGCGKSTLLRLIAGFENPSSGTVQVSGSDPIPGSSAGVVFQQPRLFPWKSVGGNIDLALKYAGVAKSERGRRRDELLDRVGLVGTADRRIWEISGGQQQRVAIARAWRPKRRCSCWTNLCRAGRPHSRASAGGPAQCQCRIGANKCLRHSQCRRGGLSRLPRRSSDKPAGQGRARPENRSATNRRRSRRSPRLTRIRGIPSRSRPCGQGCSCSVGTCASTTRWPRR